MAKPLTVKDFKNKMEYFCAYQERCHDEVISKLHTMTHDQTEIDTVIVYLIQENFLNEERFAQSFARGKHRIKHWGKVRIVNELKFRNISPVNIKTALKEISDDEYETTFEALAERQWDSITEKNALKRRKKFCDFLLRKGFESNLVYEKVKVLETLG